jgi:hypothetical protein
MPRLKKHILSHLGNIHRQAHSPEPMCSSSPQSFLPTPDELDDPSPPPEAPPVDIHDQESAGGQTSVEVWEVDDIQPSDMQDFASKMLMSYQRWVSKAKANHQPQKYKQTMVKPKKTARTHRKHARDDAEENGTIINKFFGPTAKKPRLDDRVSISKSS